MPYVMEISSGDSGVGDGVFDFPLAVEPGTAKGVVGVGWQGRVDALNISTSGVVVASTPRSCRTSSGVGISLGSLHAVRFSGVGPLSPLRGAREMLFVGAS